MGINFNNHHQTIEERIKSVYAQETQQRQMKIDYNNKLATAYIQLVSDVAGEIPQRNQAFAIQAESKTIGDFYRKEDSADKRSIAILNQHGLEIYLEFDKDRVLNQSELYDADYLNRVMESAHVSVQILEGEDMGNRKVVVVTYSPSEEVLKHLASPIQYKL